MQRGGTPESNHGIFRQILAIFHRVHAGGVGHVFIHHLGQTKGSGLGVHVQRVTQMGLQSRRRPIRVQRDRAACKVRRIQLAQGQIRIRHCRAFTTPAIAGRSGFGPRTFRPDADLAQAIHMRQ